MPSHLFSLSTDSGQEDHVSMAANVALRAHEMLPRLAEVLAAELAFAAQAAQIRKEMAAIPSAAPGDGAARREWHAVAPEERRLSEVSEAVLDAVGRHFPVVIEDRPLGPDLARLGQAILEGEIVAAVEAHSDVFRDFRPA